jgi:hypothetical protein
MNTVQNFQASEDWEKPPSVDDTNDGRRKKRRKYIAKAWSVWLSYLSLRLLTELSSNECKRRKIKCNGQTPCQRCGRQRIECIYVESSHRDSPCEQEYVHSRSVRLPTDIRCLEILSGCLSR